MSNFLAKNNFDISDSGNAYKSKKDFPSKNISNTRLILAEHKIQETGEYLHSHEQAFNFW